MHSIAPAGLVLHGVVEVKSEVRGRASQLLNRVTHLALGRLHETLKHRHGSMCMGDEAEGRGSGTCGRAAHVQANAASMRQGSRRN